MEAVQIGEMKCYDAAKFKIKSESVFEELAFRAQAALEGVLSLFLGMYKLKLNHLMQLVKSCIGKIAHDNPSNGLMKTAFLHFQVKV